MCAHEPKTPVPSYFKAIEVFQKRLRREFPKRQASATARARGLTARTVRSWLRQRRLPSLPALFALAESTRRPVSWWLGEEGFRIVQAPPPSQVTLLCKDCQIRFDGEPAARPYQVGDIEMTGYVHEEPATYPEGGLQGGAAAEGQAGYRGHDE